MDCDYSYSDMTNFYPKQETFADDDMVCSYMYYLYQICAKSSVGWPIYCTTECSDIKKDLLEVYLVD